MSSWIKCGKYDGNDMWEITEMRGDYCEKGTRLISINNIHINAEKIDESFEKENNVKINNIIFLSRHKAASGKPSLTVHPIGNWGKAEYGGKEGKITPTSPKLMTGLLRKIKENQLEGFDVCFEATHHGPLLDTPTIFLEIGSTESEWEDEVPAQALIKSLLEVKYNEGKNVVGIGGGHYTPRFTKAALTHKVNFGHMVANYGIPFVDAKTIKEAMESSNAEGVYFHKKAMKKSEYRKIKEALENENISVFEQSDYAEIT
ncbi:uncharacterized protein METZ01_LOCUS96659 [marine metagenome]|uniref:D-aminoacyl-tRNA deacylase n=1 Tax=marine metagenome TaxID=408172 RepID=A0A381VU47_9ZZZZ